jgi:hypothetical protein
MEKKNFEIYKITFKKKQIFNAIQCLAKQCLMGFCSASARLCQIYD